MEVFIILLLILLNGVFALAEIAIVSSRKSKLQSLAQEGDRGAQAALEISNSPSRFLSTVQIGITLVGVFAGAFGGATVSENLSLYLSTIPILDPYSDVISFVLVVSVITYLSLIIGELVPKRIALSSPEKIASLVSRPMNLLSTVSSPLVTLLSLSTDWILAVLHIRPIKEAPVSEEEVKMLIREGTRFGVFAVAEQDIVERTLKLGDKKVNSFMTPRQEIVWLNINSSFKTIRNKIAKYPHSNFPVCKDKLDEVVGAARTEDLLTDYLVDEKFDLEKVLHKPLFIPETMDGLKVLELFKKSGIHMALVIDEYGSIQGLISLTDILEEIVGDIPTVNELEDQDIVKRDDGTFLVDGLVSISKFKEYFHIRKLPGEKTGNFHTIGGFVMDTLGRIPTSGDSLEADKYKFEVMDMDGNRIDKILVVPLKRSIRF